MSNKLIKDTAATQTNDGFSDDRLLTKVELAQRLRIDPRTVNIWMKRGRLPYLKLGKSLRFRWSDVDAALNRYRVN
jgi:excisionase family DNA binding protein